MGNNQSNTPAATTNPAFHYDLQGQDWTGDAHGTEQSPIDIIPSQAKCSNLSMKMEFFLSDRTLTGIQVDDIGTSLLVKGPFSKLRATDVNGDVYEFEAIQFHFHAPAEHTINGGRYPLELHIVHQMTSESLKKSQTHRDLAVVGIFFELDKSPNAISNAFIEALKLDNVGANLNMNMHNLLGNELKDMMTYYAYKGSLTTPPCSEKANWYVFETPLKITEAQLKHFNERWLNNNEFAGGRGNYRETQPLNGRVVMRSTNCCISKRSVEEATKVSQDNNANSAKVLHKRDILFEDIADKGQLSRSGTEGFIDYPILKKSKTKEFDLPDVHMSKMKKETLKRLRMDASQEFYSI